MSRLTAVVFYLLICTQAVFAQDWYKSYRNGISALTQGNWDQAVSYLSEALALRPNPQLNAAVGESQRVSYLPYYSLGQAYMFSNNFEQALDSFQKSLAAKAIIGTGRLPALQKFMEFSEQLASVAADKTAHVADDFESKQKLSQLQALIYAAKLDEALVILGQLKNERPQDERLSVFEKWIKDKRQDFILKQQPRGSDGLLEQQFQTGLDHYLLGQYDQALQDFIALEKAQPDHPVAKGWIQRIQSEMQRLQLEGTTIEGALEPRIIERIITQTIAPVFALGSPAKSVSETRSAELDLSGQVGDDQGVSFIEFTSNGRPLLGADGQRLRIFPDQDSEPTKFAFSIQIPLQMGENQIVLTAFDVDSTVHRVTEQLSVIRKPPIYKTSTFRILMGSSLLLIAGVFFIARIVKYRIAIVNKYNPYIAGAPIRNSEMFFGREKLLKRILGMLHNNSLMVYGPRRIGKTSLQHQLNRRLDQLDDPAVKYIPVMVDLQGTHEQDFFRTLMEEILQASATRLNSNGQLGLRANEGKNRYTVRDFSRDLNRLLDVLRSSTQKKLKLVLLIDEVDQMNKYSEEINQGLRSVFMNAFAENLAAVMSGVSIKKAWESEGSPWFNFFQEIEVPPFERQDAVNLIRKPVAGIFTYEDEAVETLIRYSECKPYTIQRFCVNVIDRVIDRKQRRVTVEDVEAVRHEVLRATDVQEAGGPTRH